MGARCLGVISRPLDGLISANPLWVVDGVQMKVWIVDTLGGGRCIFASTLQALHPERRLNGSQSSLRYLNSQRQRALTHATKSYTLGRWVAEVPWLMRTMEASPHQTSLTVLLQRMSHPTTYLSACCLHVLSDMYQVGIYLIVRSVAPAASDREGGGRAAEYYHIRSPTVTSPEAHSIVLFSGVQHYETCEWLADDGVTRTRQCTVGSRMQRMLQSLCDDHSRTVEREGFDLGDDIDQIAVDRMSQATTQPDPPSPRRLRSTRSAAVLSSPTSKPTAVVGRTWRAKSGGRPQKTPTRRTAQSDSATASAKPSNPPLPCGSGPLRPSDIAQHGELYSCVSFTNVPQWVGLNTLPWNAYRLASQAGDRNAQRQAVEDLLMLPQRVLTRTSRGGGDGRRLTATVRARCRDVGEELRRYYSCPIPRDTNVQLTVTAVPLVHQASAADTESDSSDDTDVSEGDSDSDSDDDEGEGVDRDTRSFISDSSPIADDADSQAAKRAQFHAKHGHLRKAAQMLHSTTTMADLGVPEMQSAVGALHPPLPEGSMLPTATR